MSKDICYISVEDFMGVAHYVVHYYRNGLPCWNYYPVRHTDFKKQARRERAIERLYGRMNFLPHATDAGMRLTLVQTVNRKPLAAWHYKR